MKPNGRIHIIKTHLLLLSSKTSQAGNVEEMLLLEKELEMSNG
jgi:hypothetical protein